MSKSKSVFKKILLLFENEKITGSFQWHKFPVYFLCMTRVIDLFLVKVIN